MKLLIVTQKVDVNDDNLGSFHGWLEALSKKSDLFVIANFVGEHDLPENVKIFSLGKEKGKSRLYKNFHYQWLLLKILSKVDGIFFHMCPEYVIGASVLAKAYRKKTLLWYTHKAVNFKLKLAEKLVDKIFTASKESFRLPSKKVEVTGHGIDVEKFKSQNSKTRSGEKFKIITVGRVAESKNLHLLIDTAEILRNKNFDFEIKIAGVPILEQDKKYYKNLKEKIKEEKLDENIIFLGKVPNKDIAKFYQEGDLFINLSDTGSVDKAILEAMASGLKILTSNEAFKDVLPLENFTSNIPREIADKIEVLFKTGDIYKPNFANYVAKNHSISNLVNKIVLYFTV